MRLRPVKPQYRVEDLKHVDPGNFEADPIIPEKERTTAVRQPSQTPHYRRQHAATHNNTRCPVSFSQLKHPNSQFFF